MKVEEEAFTPQGEAIKPSMRALMDRLERIDDEQERSLLTRFMKDGQSVMLLFKKPHYAEQGWETYLFVTDEGFKTLSYNNGSYNSPSLCIMDDLTPKDRVEIDGEIDYRNFTRFIVDGVRWTIDARDGKFSILYGVGMPWDNIEFGPAKVVDVWSVVNANELSFGTKILEGVVSRQIGTAT